MEGLRLKKVLTHDRYSISTKSTDKFNTEQTYNNVLFSFLALIQRQTGTLYLISIQGHCIQYVSIQGHCI